MFLVIKKNTYRAFLVAFFADNSQNKQKRRRKKKRRVFWFKKNPVPTLFGQQIRGVQPGFGDQCIDGLAQARALQQGSTEIEMSHEKKTTSETFHEILRVY